MIRFILRPTPHTAANGSSISSAIFVRSVSYCPYTLNCATPFPTKNAHCCGGSRPPSNTWFVGPPVHLKRLLDRVSRFSKVHIHICYQSTDFTDRQQTVSPNNGGQEIGWKLRFRGNLFCLEWDANIYSIIRSMTLHCTGGANMTSDTTQMSYDKKKKLQAFGQKTSFKENIVRVGKYSR